MEIRSAPSSMKKKQYSFMPSAADHQIKIQHNHAFLASITDPAFCDWMAVVAFYIAVHSVEKLFAFLGQHSKDHRGRNKAVRVQLRPIHRHFRALYNVSMVVRYEESSRFNLSAQLVHSDLINGRLAEIEKFVAAKTAPPGLPAPPGPLSPPSAGS